MLKHPQIGERFYLIIFGESFDELNGEGCKMDDNSVNPKEKIEVKDQAIIIINEILNNKESKKNKGTHKFISKIGYKFPLIDHQAEK